VGVGILKGCIEKECRQIVRAGVEGTRKRRRQRKRLTDDFEEYLEIMLTINWREMVGDRKEWGKILLEAQGHSGL
jgi:hypothetical protein